MMGMKIQHLPGGLAAASATARPSLCEGNRASARQDKTGLAAASAPELMRGIKIR